MGVLGVESWGPGWSRGVQNKEDVVQEGPNKVHGILFELSSTRV